MTVGIIPSSVALNDHNVPGLRHALCNITLVEFAGRPIVIWCNDAILQVVYYAINSRNPLLILVL